VAKVVRIELKSPIPWRHAFEIPDRWVGPAIVIVGKSVRWMFKFY
jgi:hypothetical protein